ncbi:MAG TPA: hypothetical protein DDZ40_07370 [Deltaproteobacteria bacterium]|nr:hypothetical protein [Deltaproteobacteria bacterium]
MKKLKIAIGQNWIIRSPHESKLFWSMQIVARIKYGREYLFVAMKYNISPCEHSLFLFDEYGHLRGDDDDWGGLNFYLSERSRSKHSWLEALNG